MAKQSTQFKQGEARPEGSGRQPGAYARSSIDTVKAWKDAGKEPPLHVMLSAMEEELSDAENIKHKRQYRRAFPYAVAAAPYFHAKPQAGFVGDVDPLQAAAAIVGAVREMEQLTSALPVAKPPAKPK